MYHPLKATTIENRIQRDQTPAAVVTSPMALMAWITARLVHAVTVKHDQDAAEQLRILRNITEAAQDMYFAEA